MGALDMLNTEECAQLLYGWNATEREYPADKCVHELFEAQVMRTPDAVAVVFEDRALSYGELNRRANRLAHYLIGHGVKPDTVVAICMERSPEMIVALLGVLKAGGAYVPLDPSYPVERLQFMLQDSAPAVLLSDRERRVVDRPRRRSAGGRCWRYQCVAEAAGTESGSCCSRSHLPTSGVCDVHVGIDGEAEGRSWCIMAILLTMFGCRFCQD